MRTLTEHGWNLVGSAMAGAPTRDMEAFWTWSREQGDGYRLAAFLVVGFCGGTEGEGFPGFREQQADAHPVRIAWSLDSKIRTMLAEFIRNPTACMKG